MEEKNNNKSFGSIGEKIALKYLTENGYDIVAKNYRIGTFGEIDIIARESEYICFIEVKTRSSLLYGMPSEAVGKRKQDKIRKLAAIYLSRYNLHNDNVRFDVLEIIVNKNGSSYETNYINLIKNAF